MIVHSKRNTNIPVRDSITCMDGDKQRMEIFTFFSILRLLYDPSKAQNSRQFPLNYSVYGNEGDIENFALLLIASDEVQTTNFYKLSRLGSCVSWKQVRNSNLFLLACWSLCENCPYLCGMKSGVFITEYQTGSLAYRWLLRNYWEILCLTLGHISCPIG